MTKIRVFAFNPLQVNTYLLYDESGQCVIIDPACYEDPEKRALSEFIKKEKLKPVMALNTHCHIDHILGNNFVTKEFSIPLKTHKDSLMFIEKGKEYAMTFGFEVQELKKPDGYLEDGEVIEFGQQQLELIHTPGHADGSICFYHKQSGLLLCGDVLFRAGIGRTDLPTGDFDTLIESIKQKLFVLPDDVIVYPGHGPETTIGEEKRSNPFLQGSIL